MTCAYAGAGGPTRDAIPRDAVVGTGHLSRPTLASRPHTLWPIRVGVRPTTFGPNLR